VAITKTHKFIRDGNRFDYYSKLPRDFAELVTNQDSRCYGQWASAKRLTLISYREGDCVTTQCSTVEEFRQEFKSFELFYSENIGYQFKGIDPGWVQTDDVLQPWRDAGLAHLLIKNR
jgi:hypothetical protein